MERMIIPNIIFLVWIAYGKYVMPILMPKHETQSVKHCRAIEIAVTANTDSTYYEVSCGGGAKIDSILVK